MKLKIAWFSPLPPERTEIANYSYGLMPYLTNEFDVDLFIGQKTLEKDNIQIPVYNYIENPTCLKKLDQYDFRIYNMGNNPLFHTNIWKISLVSPGIVILHDAVLHHFFHSYCLTVLRDYKRYIQTMYVLYGEEGGKAAVKVIMGEIEVHDIVEKYPLTEIALLSARGFITHSKSVYTKLKDNYPTAHLNLPFQSTPTKRRKVIWKKPYSLLLFGHIGFNRRVQSILEAFSTFPHRELFNFTILGEYSIPVQQMVQGLGLEKEVELPGYVSDAELERRLSQADLVFNLRFPTMGEASSSQLRVWNHSLPSLVSNVGWYADLPDDTVFKINVEKEKEEIHKYLQLLLDDPAIFEKVGENGRNYLLSNHTGAKYARDLKHFFNCLN